MGKKAKIGKQRRDRYYHLAKETGYRSRAAFKLIQLNRKFEFLEKSRVCIDLCAAPGGWMQVAHENMPVSSIIIGVDLYPIKPIPGCMSIIGDITTDKCRTDLNRELKTWKADLILNDGAPNVGKNWLIDAYQQSLLALSALKLATQFLRRGGWFVTKVFRSKDYNLLLYTLKQLFKKVHASKPHASRNESAEIFVVCQHYLAPDKLDPKLVDPKHVFAEVDLEPKNKLTLFNCEKQRKAKPLGYPENDYTLYHKLSVKDFIASKSGIDALQDISEIVIDDENVLNHKTTTQEIIECCKDIKVLGKRELRSILTWWKTLKDEFEKKESENKVPVPEKIIEEEKPKTLEEIEDLEDEQIMKDIENLKAENEREIKRKRKKTNKEKNKSMKKLNLNMVVKGDEGPIMECDDIFSLDQIKTANHLKVVTDQSPDILAESDNESENEIKPKKVRYEKDTGHLDSKGLYYKDEESELEFSEDDSSSEKSGLGFTDSEGEEKIKKPVTKKVQFTDPDDHPLLTDLDYRDKQIKRESKADLWFKKDVFKGLLNEKDEEYEIDKMIEVYKKRGGKIIGDNDKDDVETNDVIEDKTTDDKIDDEDSDYDSDYNVDDVIIPEINKQKAGVTDGFDVAPEDMPAKKKKRKRNLTVEDLAIGSLVVNSKKSRRDIEDAGWNRYAFNDTNLPEWFVEDELKHMKKDTPVPKELITEYKERLEDNHMKPVNKKSMEAKARKKKRAIRKLEKAKKKVEAVLDNTDISEREKAKQIKT